MENIKEKFLNIYEKTNFILEKSSFLNEQQELLNKLENLKKTINKAEGKLIAGIIGGTGVGKSSLISALAQENISKISQIRPTTDQPIIYAHHEHEIIWPKSSIITHQLNSLKNLALVDLPDFDSLKSSHYQNVLNSLKKLDLLIWLTSPSKYADLKFYQIFAESSKYLSLKSQVIILNKTDELIDRYGADKGNLVIYELLSEIKNNLKKQNIFFEIPIWSFSILNAQNDSRELEPLQSFFKQLKKKKMRWQIQEANLNQKSNTLISEIKTILKPEVLTETIIKIDKLLNSIDYNENLNKLAMFSCQHIDKRKKIEILKIKQAAPFAFKTVLDLTDFIKNIITKKNTKQSIFTTNFKLPTAILLNPILSLIEDFKSIWPYDNPPFFWADKFQKESWKIPKEDFEDFLQKSFQKSLLNIDIKKKWPKGLLLFPYLISAFIIIIELESTKGTISSYFAAFWRVLPTIFIVLPLSFVFLANFNLFLQNKKLDQIFEKKIEIWLTELETYLMVIFNKPLEKLKLDLIFICDELKELTF